MAYGQYGSRLITSFLQGIVQGLMIHACINDLSEMRCGKS